ncbi:MAG: oligosaccharide flippase family protein [Candidatus Eisenbacteria bacterium]|uniref:Oligosaccharide flippase family protein n=1 Tax=Eiseniibacteriota bacterium TaxID=2212470 RepID=A0A7Y2E8L7_UNCEI|nr:oligosaccharide flippase family protein [Candidatus Eisenbacteria bacterium]
MDFKRHSTYLFMLRMMTLVSGAVTSMIVARTLGPEGKGVIDLVMLLPQFVSSLGSMGVQASAIYFAGRGFSHRNLVQTVFGLGLAFSALHILLVWIFKDEVAGVMRKGGEHKWVILSVAMIPFYLLWKYSDCLLQGMFRFGAYTSLQMASLIFRLVGVILFLLALGFGLAYGVWIYVLSALIPAVVSMVLSWVFSKRSEKKASTKEILKYGFQVHWGNLAQRGNLELDRFIINPLLGTAAVGLYGISVLMGQLAVQVSGAVSQVLFPKVAKEGKDALDDTCFLSRSSIAISVAGSAGLALVGWYLIRWVFGEEFAPSYKPMLWLLPGIVMSSMGMVLSQYLAGIGKPNLNSIASVIALLVNIPALLFLIPKYDISGAAIATTIAYTIQAGIIAFYFARETSKGPSAFMLATPADVARFWQLGMSLLKRRPGK